MAYEISNYAVKATFVAATDLTLNQYEFVEFDPTGTGVGASGNAALALGVLQNAPRLGEEAEVVLVGITKVKSAGFIYAGTPVTIAPGAGSPGAQSWTPAGGGAILGKALTSAQYGEIATVAISTPSAS